MSTAKERVSEIVQAQPDDSSFDEILRELAFSRMVEKGLEDSRQDRIIFNEVLPELQEVSDGNRHADFRGSLRSRLGRFPATAAIANGVLDQGASEMTADNQSSIRIIQ
jgi:hypothetical protein